MLPVGIIIAIIALTVSVVVLIVLYAWFLLNPNAHASNVNGKFITNMYMFADATQTGNPEGSHPSTAHGYGYLDQNQKEFHYTITTEGIPQENIRSNHFKYGKGHTFDDITKRFEFKKDPKSGVLVHQGVWKVDATRDMFKPRHKLHLLGEDMTFDIVTSNLEYPEISGTFVY